MRLRPAPLPWPRLSASNPRDCSLCRNCLHAEGAASDSESSIVLGQVKDHFLFTVESAGQMPAEELFRQAVKILEDKAGEVMDRLG